MEVMEDHQAHQAQTSQSQTQIQSSPRNHCTLERNEPVRSRWTPKPEQILILESIFNSGMVNPPKEETVKIRKLLEKFGSVGDANVFYWFQNRRSRSRRRQRQIQASLINSGSLDQHQQQQQQQSPMLTRCGGGGVIEQYQAVYTATTTSPEFIMQQPPSGFFPMLQSLSPVAGSSSSSSPPSSRIDGGVEYPFSGQSIIFPEFEHNTPMPSSSLLHLDTSKVHYEFALGVITVFINGVPTEVESGPLNIKSMFNEEVMLVHSSGVPVPLDEYGISMPGLQHGESYFLVSRPS